MEKIVLGKSQQTYEQAKKVIAGGTQLLSKRPEMFLPDLWPAYFEKAKGCALWDLDGNHYLDTAYMGVGANLLGFADDDVDNAVIDVIRKGINTTLNAPEEVELAELLLELHPWADMTRFTKTGGEAMAVAVRIARAATGKDKVLFCGYHGWHDWYISSNLADDKLGDGHLLPGLAPSGVPRDLLETSIPFTYNNTAEFLEKVDKYDGKLACVVIESVRNFEPEDGFFDTIQRVCREKGIVLILDEITAGFRMNIGGAHLRYNITPDIAVFGKAFSNGYPMAAVIGKKEVMEAAQGSFISSLFWTERTGPAAVLATIRKMQQIDSPSTIVRLGTELQAKWKSLAESAGLSIKVAGFPAISSFGFQHDNPLVLKTFLTQEMLKKGYLATTALYVSCAHDGHLDGYYTALEEVFHQIGGFIQSGESVANHLQGPVCHSGFKRLT